MYQKVVYNVGGTIKCSNRFTRVLFCSIKWMTHAFWSLLSVLNVKRKVNYMQLLFDNLFLSFVNFLEKLATLFYVKLFICLFFQIKHAVCMLICLWVLSVRKFFCQLHVLWSFVYSSAVRGQRSAWFGAFPDSV